jgi:autotransporter-associated beta strand protein
MMGSIDSNRVNKARLVRVLLAGTAISAAATLPAAAQTAAWAPGGSDYNLSTNWSPNTVPLGPTGVAVFDVANKTSLTFSAPSTTVSTWNFNSTAPAYNFLIAGGQSLTFSNIGATNHGGIINNGNAPIDIANSGTLKFFGNSAVGPATITTRSGGSTVFDIAGQTDGINAVNARLITEGGGTVDVSQGGPGVVVGSIEGAGNYVIGSRTFFVGGNNASVTEVSGVVSGNGGSLQKYGSGTLTLSGINTYTGSTGVVEGTLLVNGSISSGEALVLAGAVLGGTGTIQHNARIISGGTFAPGSGAAGSSMAVDFIRFDPGAIYRVNVNPTVASAASASSAVLAGTVQAQFAAGSYVARNYTILTTTGGLGTARFDALTTNNLPAGFTSHLSYTSNNVLLNLEAVLGIPTGSSAVGAAALQGNQLNVANTINGFFNNGGTLPPAFLNLFGLTGAPLGTALTQLSGETATASQQSTFNAMTQFMGVMTDPFMAGRGEVAAGAVSAASYAEVSEGGNGVRDAYGMFNKAPMGQAYDSRWSVWAAGFGGSQTTDGNAAIGSNNATSRIFGTAAGADYRLSPFTIAGFALAGGGTNFSVANGGSGRSDLFQAGAYLRHNVGAAYISAALAYGWQDITTDRTVTASGIDRLRAEFNANAFSGRLESGYRLVSAWMGGLGLTPYAAGQFTNFDRPAYTESVVAGGNAFALAYGAKSVTDSRSELGLRTDRSFAMPDGVFTLRGRAAWAHDFNPDRSLAATFQALPGASILVNGAAQASNSALTTASAEIKWLNGWSTAATFEGEFSDVTRSYAGKGVVRYTW